MMLKSQFAKKSMAAALAAATLAGAVSAADARDRWHRHHHHGHGGAVAAGVLGGLALGAVIGGAAANSGPIINGPPPSMRYRPYRPACYTVDERVWVRGWGWQIRPVTVCD